MTEIDRVFVPMSPLVQNALSILAETSAVVGEDYFPVLVEGLANALGVRWSFVCRLDAATTSQAQTIAFWDNGQADNFVYQLENTPCADVVQNGVCLFPEKITALFPLDEMLIDMGVESYAGTPLRASDGRILGLVVVLDDKPIADPAAVEEIMQLFAGRAAAELERLVASSLSERLGKIVEASVSEAYVFDSHSFRFELVNRGARENLGYTMEELRELTPWDLKPDFTREEFLELVKPLIDGDQEILVFETNHRRKDGSTYPVCVHLQYFPDVGEVFFASIIDETDRKQREKQEKILLHEINHRAKNVLSVAQVLARQTAKRSSEDYVERLESRIPALSASHDCLVANDWKDIPFDQLIRSQLGHFRHLIGKRIKLDGPKEMIRAEAAQGFGLALHELATNAAKYGALSNDVGEVLISWVPSEEDEDDQSFSLAWIESGGPEVSKPAKAGFGSSLIENSLSAQFGCKVSLQFEPKGLRCTFKAPAHKVLALDPRPQFQAYRFLRGLMTNQAR